MTCTHICSKLGFVAIGAVVAFLATYFVMRTPAVDSLDAQSPVEEITWQTVTIGNIVTFEIPSTCQLDPGAGNAYLICPTAENAQPTPEMNFSSDGITVNVHRWEGLETPYWDHIVASMKVVQPMTHNITINVEK
ncbi:MAG: hypothetical protein WCT28_03440 [Patescibacteria group bacterium]|jgi:hypothetical protein